MNTEYERILTEGLELSNHEWLIQSLKDLSYDDTAGGDNGECFDRNHPTNSECRAISFDNLAMLHQIQIGARKRLRSCDALYIGDIASQDGKPEIYIIEFKNGVINESVVNDINQKIKDGVQLLNSISVISDGSVDLTNRNNPKLITNCREEHKLNLDKRLNRIGISGNYSDYCRQHMNFILVYNENKKTNLLDCDLDSFIDDIEEGIIYKELEEAVKICLTNSISKNWLYKMAGIEPDKNPDEKNILISILQKAKGNSKHLSWFDNLAEVITIQKKVIEGTEESLKIENNWDSFSDEQKSGYYSAIERKYKIWKGLGNKDEEKKRDKHIALCIKGFTEKLSCDDTKLLNGRDVLLNTLCIEKEPPSTLFYKKTSQYIKKQKELRDLENGKYNKEIDSLMKCDFLIPIEFGTTINDYRERAVEYLKFVIDSGKLEDFLQELKGKVPNIGSFTILIARNAQKPHNFFRFNQWNRLYIKSAATYGRREFQERFIESICNKRCNDYGPDELNNCSAIET